MKKKMFISLLLLCTVLIINAYEYKESGTRQYMGIHISDLCGSGLMYRVAGNPFGFGLVVGGNANGKDGIDFKTSFNSGAMGTIELKNFQKTSFFFFLAGSLHYKEDRENIPEIEQTWDGKDFKTNIDRDWYYGTGIGLDIQLSKWGMFSLNWPLTIRNDGYMSMYIPMASILVRFR